MSSFPMTVAELIALLSALPPATIVQIAIDHPYYTWTGIRTTYYPEENTLLIDED